MKFATLITALAVVSTPALLFAHARLVRSTPAADAHLTTAPAALQLWFSERPETKFSKIQLLDSSGTPVTLGDVASLPGDAMALTIPITDALPNGRYTVSWRTAAADGHPSSGKFSFTVQVPTAPIVVVDTAIAPAQPRTSMPNSPLGTSEPTAFSTSARWAELVAVLTLIGAVVFQLFVLPDAAFGATPAVDAADRARRLANAVLVLFLITTLWRLSSQADLMVGASSLGASMLSVVRDTRWGHAWGIGAIGAIAAAVGLFAARRQQWGWVLAGLGAVAICFGESLTGHAGAIGQRAALAVGVDIAHVLGAGAWLGGLVAVLLAGLPAANRLEADERRKTGQRLVRSYHKSAIQCVVLVLLTACLAAWLRLDAAADLWTTPYGRLLVVKFILVVAVLAFGWFHWKTVVKPEWNDDTGFRFARSAVGELVVGAAVIAATAMLVSTALPR